MTKDRGYRRNLTNYGDRKFALYLRRSFAQSTGLSRALMDRPIVGIAHTVSGFNNCHRGVPELVEAVKRGVLAAGGLPLEFPTISLGEVFLSPTSLMFRNLMAMDVEEMIRAQPMDAVVLIGGCDKTVPAQLMGAASADLPAIQLVTGPMLASRIAASAWAPAPTAAASGRKYRAGEIDDEGIDAHRGQSRDDRRHLRGDGHRQHDGLHRRGARHEPARTRAAIPAVHADRLRAAEASGARAVATDRAAADGRARSSRAQSVENALRVLLAIGGSTNAIIHLTAIAGRRGIRIVAASGWTSCRTRRRCWST